LFKAPPLADLHSVKFDVVKIMVHPLIVETVIITEPQPPAVNVVIIIMEHRQDLQ
jgi:hypothetical protein